MNQVSTCKKVCTESLIDKESSFDCLIFESENSCTRIGDTSFMVSKISVKRYGFVPYYLFSSLATSVPTKTRTARTKGVIWKRYQSGSPAQKAEIR